MYKELLIQARALIDTPEKWARETFARNLMGDKAGLNSSEACSFCMMGAMLRVDPVTVDELFFLVRKFLPPGYMSLPRFNDDPNTTHADVLAVFDRAIASCP